MPTLTNSSNRQVERGVRSTDCQPWWQGDMPPPGQQETVRPQGSGEGIPKDTETNAALNSGSLSTYFTSVWSVMY